MTAGESAAEQAKRMREKARRLEQAADNYERGAEGERRIGAVLDGLPPEFVVFHDLKLPDSKANVDHLVVGPSGVWAVDSKNYSYAVTIGTGKGAGTLWTGRQPMTKTLETSAWEASAVADLIGFRVDPLLCIIAPSLPSQAFDFGGLRICSPAALAREFTVSWRPSIDVDAAVAAVRHVFRAEPSVRTWPASAAVRQSASEGPPPQMTRAVRERSSPLLTERTKVLLKLLGAILFLLFGVSLVANAFTAVGQEAGQRLAESITPTTLRPATSTTATTVPSTVPATTIAVSPPPPVAYATACSLGGTAWDITWVWPGDLPAGVAGYGVRTRRGDGPTLDHSLQVWNSSDSKPVDLRVSSDTADFIVITEYRDAAGSVLAATEEPFRVPSLVC